MICGCVRVQVRCCSGCQNLVSCNVLRSSEIDVEFISSNKKEEGRKEGRKEGRENQRSKAKVKKRRRRKDRQTDSQADRQTERKKEELCWEEIKCCACLSYCFAIAIAFCSLVVLCLMPSRTIVAQVFSKRCKRSGSSTSSKPRLAHRVH